MAQGDATDAATTTPAPALAELDARYRRLQICSERLSIGLRIIFTAAAWLVAAALVAMAWKAWNSRGIVIESFHVPPSLEARGLTGEVVANAIIDRFSDMRDGTAPIMPADALEAGWRDDYRVEIPQVGLSVGEARSALRRWLSDDTRVGGEIIRTPLGIRLTVRSIHGSESFDNEAGDLDILATSAAEDIYRRTSPHLYARYLGQEGRAEEAIALLEGIARSDAGRVERARALSGLGNRYNSMGRCAEAVPVLQRAVRLDPRLPHAVNNLGHAHSCLGHDQLAVDLSGRAIAMVRRGDLPEAHQTPWSRRAWLREEASVAELFGDQRGALRLLQRLEAEGDSNPLRQATALARLRDMDASRRLLVTWTPVPGSENDKRLYWSIRTAQAAAMEDWHAAAAFSTRMIAACRRSGEGCTQFVRIRAQPYHAAALARAGDLAAAQALADELPHDCYKCAWARAVVADRRGDAASADRWFGRAVAMGPRLPFAFQEWGEALAARGDHARALARFDLALRHGPDFADAHKGRGDALAALRRFDEAAVAYGEAAERAPRWGMLHLAWARTLWRLGRRADAYSRLCAADGMALPVRAREWLRNFKARRHHPCPPAGAREPLQSSLDLSGRIFSFDQSVAG